MSRILCTFPGKFGDLLWALPTIRAISRRLGQPVDLVVAAPFYSICTLIEQQSYIGYCHDHADWQVEDTAPISPRIPPTLPTPGTYDAVIHLGYRGWPTPDLARHTHMTYVLWRLESVERQQAWPALSESELALDEPWITVPDTYSYRWGWLTGFTDEHFELKYGLYTVLERIPRPPGTLPPFPLGRNARWESEGGYTGMTWQESAAALKHTRVLLADCSALHVLAVAMGIPVVLMEPNPHRHNDTFYPLGKVGPQVTLVVGNDGRPTFDARHVADAITRRLGELR